MPSPESSQDSELHVSHYSLLPASTWPTRVLHSRHTNFLPATHTVGLPWWLRDKESTCSAGDQGSIPGSERSPGGGNDNPLQYSYLGNPTDRGAWRATIHGIAELDTTEHAHKVGSPTSVGLCVGCVNALPLGRIPLIQKDFPQYNSPHLCHLLPVAPPPPHYYLISAVHPMAFNCVPSASFSNIYKS